MKDYGDSKSFYCHKRKWKAGYNASFDDMPAEHKEVHVKRRNMLCVVDPKEKEKNTIMMRKNVIKSKTNS